MKPDQVHASSRGQGDQRWATKEKEKDGDDTNSFNVKSNTTTSNTNIIPSNTNETKSTSKTSLTPVLADVSSVLEFHKESNPRSRDESSMGETTCIFTGEIKIQNIYPDKYFPLFFKIKTTAPEKFAVNQIIGFIPAGLGMTVRPKVVVRPDTVIWSISHERFQVLVMLAPEQLLEQKTLVSKMIVQGSQGMGTSMTLKLHQLWNRFVADGAQVESHRVQCILKRTEVCSASNPMYEEHENYEIITAPPPTTKKATTIASTVESQPFPSTISKNSAPTSPTVKVEAEEEQNQTTSAIDDHFQFSLNSPHWGREDHRDYSNGEEISQTTVKNAVEKAEEKRIPFTTSITSKKRQGRGDDSKNTTTKLSYKPLKQHATTTSSTTITPDLYIYTECEKARTVMTSNCDKFMCRLKSCDDRMDDLLCCVTLRLVRVKKLLAFTIVFLIFTTILAYLVYRKKDERPFVDYYGGDSPQTPDNINNDNSDNNNGEYNGKSECTSSGSTPPSSQISPTKQYAHWSHYYI